MATGLPPAFLITFLGSRNSVSEAVLLVNKFSITTSCFLLQGYRTPPGMSIKHISRYIFKYLLRSLVQGRCNKRGVRPGNHNFSLFLSNVVKLEKEQGLVSKINSMRKEMNNWQKLAISLSLNILCTVDIETHAYPQYKFDQPL